MSTHRLGNQKVISAHYLTQRLGGPRRLIVDMIDDLLYEIQRETGAGEDVVWETLNLTVEPEHGISDGLRFRATVDMHRDDVVAGLTAAAPAEHERSKRP